MSEYSIEVDEDTANLLSELARMPSDPIAIAAVAQIGPESFLLFMEDAGLVGDRMADTLLAAASEADIMARPRDPSASDPHVRTSTNSGSLASERLSADQAQISTYELRVNLQPSVTRTQGGILLDRLRKAITDCGGEVIGAEMSKQCVDLPIEGGRFGIRCIVWFRAGLTTIAELAHLFEAFESPLEDLSLVRKGLRESVTGELQAPIVRGVPAPKRAQKPKPS
jgi:hypothetical protein